MKAPQQPKTVSVFVPFKLTKRGGRKEMILPPANELSRPRHDNTVLKALARAFRWKRMLERGSYASITELAEQEKIGMSYLTRVMRMTLLAPDIIDAILEGRQGDGIDLTVLAAPFPTEWGAQRRHFGLGPSITKNCNFRQSVIAGGREPADELSFAHDCPLAVEWSPP